MCRYPRENKRSVFRNELILPAEEESPIQNEKCSLVSLDTLPTLLRAKSPIQALGRRTKTRRHASAKRAHRQEESYGDCLPDTGRVRSSLKHHQGGASREPGIAEFTRPALQARMVRRRPHDHFRAVQWQSLPGRV